ncbi:hypothetical protein [Desulfosporosinus nitroreducens]|uniref:Uncharacterized protein n=1 Tax=Desulfosporosinus nitroreducens TaxID=2018668 RepID=A0ABT8QTE3_9FIRM|nr:hypothetical protein [Desulfosporosinus nitroreducens]MCO1603750.1 hypothetical protein [Desulfosporosinus nitroreducens]MDO0823156.1 hypothetical protein [Desulfosporosinus nitroreducens]
MTNQDLIINQPHFIRFVRVLKEIEVNDASRRLSVSRRTYINPSVAGRRSFLTPIEGVSYDCHFSNFSLSSIGIITSS